MTRTNIRENFWERFPLEKLNEAEWEALCDGCGKCCLLKYEIIGNEPEVEYTSVACRLLDTRTCRCKHYSARTKIVSDCVHLNLETIDKVIGWMPSTCAYRLLHEGKPLFEWHHLLSGDPNLVHEVGASVSSWAISETEISHEDLLDYTIERP